ncbi:hypothetical protein TSOC_014071, partial [Tetrabaena socialis]
LLLQRVRAVLASHQQAVRDEHLDLASRGDARLEGRQRLLRRALAHQRQVRQLRPGCSAPPAPPDAGSAPPQRAPYGRPCSRRCWPPRRAGRRRRPRWPPAPAPPSARHRQGLREGRPATHDRRHRHLCAQPSPHAPRLREAHERNPARTHRGSV